MFPHGYFPQGIFPGSLFPPAIGSVPSWVRPPGVPFPGVFTPTTTVDILLVTDQRVGARMERSGSTVIVVSGVVCYYQEVDPLPALAGGRESTTHQYCFYFFGPPLSLTRDHRLAWTDPDTDRSYILEVTGSRRRGRPGFPDRITATRRDSGVSS